MAGNIILGENLSSDPSNPPEGLIKRINGVPKIADANGNMQPISGWETGTSLPSSLEEGGGYLDISNTAELYAGPSGGGGPVKIGDGVDVVDGTVGDVVDFTSTWDNLAEGGFLLANGAFPHALIQKINGNGYLVLNNYIELQIYVNSSNYSRGFDPRVQGQFLSTPYDQADISKSSTGRYTINWSTSERGAASYGSSSYNAFHFHDHNGNVINVATEFVFDDSDTNSTAIIKFTDTSDNAIDPDFAGMPDGITYTGLIPMASTAY